MILLLPLAGIRALRLYENELARQTEAALVAEGVYVREHFLAELLRTAGPEAGEPWGELGHPLPAERRDPLPDGEPFDPIVAEVDLAREEIRPRAPEATAPEAAPDPRFLEAGRAVSELLRRSQRHTLAGARVVDAAGVVVATSRGELGLSLIAREEIRRALRGERLTLLRVRVSDEPPPPLAGISRGNRIRLFVALPVVHGDRVLGAVVLSRTPLELTRALHQNRFVLLRYAGALVVLVLLVSLLTATTITRPIRALIRQAERVREGAAARPLEHPGSREVELLSESVAQMAETLAARASYIESFARSVSHEFKTPLASVRGTVELLRDHLAEMSPGERTRFLDLLDRESLRMQRLVDRLLELARADTLRPGSVTTSATAIAARAVERFREGGLRIAFEAEGGEVPVRVGEEALEVLLDNLLQNARQHAGEEARVSVRLARGADGFALLSVSDDGPGISPANMARACEPFFTTARERGGTGLGLAIARALAAAHGGELALEPSAAGGLRVTARLPIAGS